MSVCAGGRRTGGRFYEARNRCLISRNRITKTTTPDDQPGQSRRDNHSRTIHFQRQYPSRAAPTTPEPAGWPRRPDRPSGGASGMAWAGLGAVNPSKCCGGPPALLPCFAMWRRRIRHQILRGTALLGAASAISLSCSSSTPIDMNIGSDAGTGFDAPVRETGPDTAGVGGESGAAGTGDVGGASGASGAGGAGGAAGTGVGGAGGTALLNNQYQHPNRPPRLGAA